MRDIWVVSNDRRNFDTFMSEASKVAQFDFEIKNKMIHYLEHPSELNDAPPSRVFLLGSYFKRMDWDLIEKIIATKGHRSLLIR